jgi:MarR family transcriptional regulator, transcriptional regulator for hemolysin
MKRSRKREFAFLLHDTARLLRTRADQRVRVLGMTRAQWAVLSRLERSQGLKQAELAEALDLQPITLTRLVDRLCASGLVERRADPLDRRAKRLFLTPAARPVMERLAQLGEAMMTDALQGIDEAALAQMLGHLTQVMDNLRAGPADAAPERIARAERAHG